MTDAEILVLRNLLNGVDPAAAGRAAGKAEDEVSALFAHAMRHVGEYALVHCVPNVECQSLPAARRNRLAVLEVIAAIQRWDAEERELVLAIVKGRNVVREGVSRETAVAIFDRALEALPHYLLENQMAAYKANRGQFVRDNRSAVVAILERFVSFREPFLYKQVTNVPIGMDWVTLPAI
jgi:hypothetical protein